jgi:murein DD-endopeptidase MepM/ murein hydrolase activator NlpD
MYQAFKKTLLQVPSFLSIGCLLIIAVLVLSDTKILALSEEDTKSIHRDSVHYKVPTYSDGACGADIVLTGNSNAAKAFNFFVSKGLQPHQAAGIVGNLIAESSVIPDRKQGSGLQTIQSPLEIVPNVGFGIAQWTTAGRQQALLKFAREQNADPLTLELQLLYLMHELETNPSYGLKELKAANDLRQATWIFLAFFERPATVVNAGLATNPTQPASGPAKATLDERVSLAQAASKNEGDKDAAGTSYDSTCASGNAEGEVVSADGYTFPLRASRETITKGGWCYRSSSNCHHDYNAADIMAPTGTPVLATKGGKVVSAKDRDSSSIGSRVTIMGEDGKLYYYAHMGEGTIKVRTNQRVSAGTQLGQVGTSADAAGTAPHLHIDMLPGDKYSFRPSCSGAACSGYPFGDIQPIMAKVFQSVK